MTDSSVPAIQVPDEVIANMIATVPFGLLVIGSNNSIVVANTEGASLFGLDFESSQGTSLTLSLIHI